MILKRLVDSALLWLAVCAPFVASYAMTATESKVSLQSDAQIPAELIAGEYRGPTAEAIIQWFDRNDPESVMPPDAID